MRKISFQWLLSAYGQFEFSIGAAQFEATPDLIWHNSFADINNVVSGKCIIILIFHTNH